MFNFEWFKANVKPGDTVKMQYHSQYREAIVEGRKGSIMRMGHTHVMQFKEIREFEDYDYPQTYLVFQIDGIDEPIKLEDIMELIEINGKPVKVPKNHGTIKAPTGKVPSGEKHNVENGRHQCPAAGCDKNYANAGALYNHRKRVGH